MLPLPRRTQYASHDSKCATTRSILRTNTGGLTSPGRLKVWLLMATNSSSGDCRLDSLLTPFHPSPEHCPFKLSCRRTQDGSSDDVRLASKIPSNIFWTSQLKIKAPRSRAVKKMTEEAGVGQMPWPKLPTNTPHLSISVGRSGWLSDAALIG